VRILKVTEPLQQGEDVRDVQEALVKLGLLIPDQVDGFYGQDTESAVETFQKRNGLAVDGQVGPASRKALKITV
jgi:peptidoglycan hydrolase-like protein with peptidoglycan-binding domain